jgi:hypothetical protein
MNNHQPNKNGVAPYKKDYIKYNNHSNLFNRHYNNPPAIKVNNVKEKS